MAQWLRVCLLMQGTRVQALAWEDPTCRGVAGPVSHNCWACAFGACAPQRERPAHRDEEWPPLATTGESPRTETKTQHSQNQSINQSNIRIWFKILIKKKKKELPTSDAPQSPPLQTKLVRAQHSRRKSKQATSHAKNDLRKVRPLY